jgi:uncharacterized protein (DUF3084 family)
VKDLFAEGRFFLEASGTRLFLRRLFPDRELSKRGDDGAVLERLGDINWKLLIVLVLVSAVVAYVGDVLGMRIGKKRISIFGLRPRYTSSIVTAVTGVFITLATLAILSTTTDTVRTALFSLKFVQRQITELTSQLQENQQEMQALELRLFENQAELAAKRQELARVERRLAESEESLRTLQEQLESSLAAKSAAEARRQELEREVHRLEAQRTELQEDIETLRKGLEQIRAGRIIVLAGEIIAQLPLPQGSDGIAAEEAVRSLRERAVVVIRRRLPEGSEEMTVEIGEDSLRQVLDRIGAGGSPLRMVLRLVASSNAVLGERVQTKVEALESTRIYEAGTVLLVREIQGGLTLDAAEAKLYEILAEVNGKATADGVLRDPLRGTVGNLAAAEFFDAVEKIASSKGTLELVVTAAETTFTEGPVQVELEVRSPEEKTAVQ